MHIAIREGHELVSLPDGASYLGFIFATAATPDEVEIALRRAYEKMNIVVAPLWKISGALSDLSTTTGTETGS